MIVYLSIALIVAAVIGYLFVKFDNNLDTEAAAFFMVFGGVIWPVSILIGLCSVVFLTAMKYIEWLESKNVRKP